jgi:hypothetical protein
MPLSTYTLRVLTVGEYEISLWGNQDAAQVMTGMLTL